MRIRIYWIEHPKVEPKSIGIMARPRGNDWLDSEVLSLKKQGVKTLISLLENHEIRELNLTEEAEACAKHDIEFIHYPIQDRSFPKDKTPFTDLAEEISQSPKATVIHCRMGIGRSSLLAAASLVRQGIDPKSVFELISRSRNLEVPDTQEQIDWFFKNVSGN